MKNILIVAGETSGDIHASHLIKNLKTLNPDLAFCGIGGKRMHDAGVEIIYPIENLSIIGVSEIFCKIGHLRQAYKNVMASVVEKSVKTVILVDYPGFNLLLAKALKKKGITVIYYITPQVWAWGKFRIRSIKKYVDKALVIFKFEEDLFRKHSVTATFVGHPLLDADVKPYPDKSSLGLVCGKMTIALLPGSRESEIKRKLPIMLKTAELLKKRMDLQFILLKTSSVDEAIYKEILGQSGLTISEIKDNSYGCLSVSDFVLTSSGTATLECAIMERPMLITYQTSLLTGLLFKVFARTRFIGLVNIIAGKIISPEILQYDANPKSLSRAIFSIISSKEKMDKQIKELREVKHSLGTPGGSLRAAGIINNFIKLQQ